MRATLKSERFKEYKAAKKLMEELNKKDLDHTHIESGDDHFVLWAELDSDSPEKQVIRGTDLSNLSRKPADRRGAASVGWIDKLTLFLNIFSNCFSGSITD